MSRWKLTIGLIACAGFFATATVPTAGAHLGNSCSPYDSGLTKVVFGSASCRYDCKFDQVSLAAGGANVQVSGQCVSGSCTAWTLAGTDTCTDSGSAGCGSLSCHDHGTCTTEPRVPGAALVHQNICGW